MMVVLTGRDIIAIAFIVLVVLLLGGAWMLDKLSDWRRRRKKKQ